MKYKGSDQKTCEWILQLVAGLALVTLPFVISFVGWDTFRLPKDSFCILTTALLILLLVSFKRMSIQHNLSGWEWLLLGGVLYVGLHTLVSSNPELSWNGFQSLLVFTLLYWVLRSISTLRFQQTIWFCIGAALGVNGVLTVFQYYGMLDWMRSSTGRVIHGRINPAGFIGEVNSGGFLFGLTILILVFYVATEQRTLIRIFGGVLIGLNLLGLAFARGLTASVGLFACLLLWVLFHHWWILRNQRDFGRHLSVFWVLLFLVLAGGLAVAYQSGVVQRVVRVTKATQRGDWTLATAGRVPVYWLTWQMIKEKPFVGAGFHTFGSNFFFYRAETDAGQSVTLLQQSGAFRETHNEYLQVWYELGLIGLLIFLVLLFWPILLSLRRIRELTDPEEVYWLGIMTLGLIYVAISCLAFFPLHLSVTASYVVLLVGGIRAMQVPPSLENIQKGGLVRPVLVGSLLVLSILFGWKAVNDWRSNKEAGIATFLLRTARTQNYRPAQKMAIADEALARLERAEELSPAFYEIFNLKGTVLMLLGRYEEAVESYSRGVVFSPSPELYTNLAAAYMAIGQKQRAKGCLDLALSYAPTYRKARQALRFLESEK